MAKPKSTTRVRVRKKVTSRNGAKDFARPCMPTSSVPLGLEADGQDAPPTQSLSRIIEGERSRLTTAQSVLSCVREALAAAEDREQMPCGYADVVNIAQQLVREAVHRLDSVFVKPFLDGLSSPPRRRRKQVGASDE